MSLLVLSTIIGYFILLPRAIPKQIIVAVLPFDGPETLSPHLTQEFPRHIRELVALSRDLTFVDFDAARAAIDLREDFRGFTHELGVTHIVDGDFVEDQDTPDSFLLTVRVVDVTRPAWKLKWHNVFRYPDESLLSIRNQAVDQILGGLYDNSVGEISDEESIEGDFENYLRAQSLFHSQEIPDARAILLQASNIYSNAFALYLLSRIEYDRKTEFLDLAVSANPRHYPSLIEQAWNEYSATGDLPLYTNTVTELAGTFPNSHAVLRMADLYSALGWFEEEEQLLLRWAKMRPRSGLAALRIGLSRFRSGSDAGVEEALTIASAREPENSRVKLFAALYDLEVRDGAIDLTESVEFEVRHLAINGRIEEARGVLATIQEQLSCDELVENALYLGDLNFAFKNLACSDQFWTQPPGWWLEEDPRWQVFVSDPRYSEWQRSRGLVRSTLDQLTPVSIPQLFAPVRKLLPENAGAQAESP